MTVSPGGDHVYVAGTVDDAVSVFSRHAVTGALTFVEVQKDGVDGIDGLDGAASVTVSPDGSHVYVAGFSDDALAVFQRDATTGALTFVEVQKDGMVAVDGLEGANSVTVSPDSRHVYVAGRNDDAVLVFSRDATTGVLTFVEFKKDGMGGVDGLDQPWSVTVSPDGSHVYATSRFDDAVAVSGCNDGSTDVRGGAERRHGGVDGLNGANSVTVSPDGSHVYTAGLNDSAVSVFSRLVVGFVVRYVATTGSDAGNDCTHPGTPCATIAHAVNEADNGDTLNIAAGTYTEPGLVIDKELDIQAQGVVVQ